LDRYSNGDLQLHRYNTSTFFVFLPQQQAPATALFLLASIHFDSALYFRICNKLLMKVGAYFEGDKLGVIKLGAVELAVCTDFEKLGKLVVVDNEDLAAVACKQQAEDESIALPDVLPVT